MKLKDPLILGSQSPRRQHLMRELGLDFTIKTIPIDEIYPSDIDVRSIPAYLARKKSEAFGREFENYLVLTADTVVAQGSEILGKPGNENEAEKMLKQLSGKTHSVITGICLKKNNNYHIIDDTTEVTFKNLSGAEIKYYIKHYMPLDKAGAYGIQEWIGMVGIEKIKGSYFNVVGLPVFKIYELFKSLELIII